MKSKREKIAHKQCRILLVFVLMLMTSFHLYTFAESDGVDSNGINLVNGIVTQFDSVRGRVKISGELEYYLENQNITLLVVPGGTDINKFKLEDAIYILQKKTDSKAFEFEFRFSKNPGDSVDIYIGGTGILTPAKTNIAPKFEYVLVDRLNVSASRVAATAYMRNYSDEAKAVSMIIAQYDADKKLLDVYFEEKTVEANTDVAVTGSIVAEKLLDDTKYVRAFVWNGEDKMIPLTLPIEKGIKEGLSVLAIGNSFSEDSVEYLYQIAADAGIKDILIGNLYIGGCSLEKHYNNASNNSRLYTYYKNTTGSFVKTTSSTMYDALTEEEWDVVVMQQVSGLSGEVDTYEPYLTGLKDYVKNIVPNAVFAWNMTWAYQGNSTHKDFPRYDSNQLTMYNAITSAVKSRIVPDSDFEYIIPAGTAIQNARGSKLGDTLTRDGYHLSLKLGRYIAGLTWFKMLTGRSIDDIEYAPDGVSEEEIKIAKEAVNNAYANPFEITASIYTE